MEQVREIEFRAKAIHDNKWVYGFPMHYKRPMYEKWTIREPSGLEHDVEESTLGQYTGLTDSKGKRIYEGDVLAFGSDCKSTVTYENGCFYVKYKKRVLCVGCKFVTALLPVVISNTL